MTFNKILFLGAHTDDELACSATLCKFMEKGSEIFVAVFSFCEESVPSGFPKNILNSEFDKAMRVLGIKNIFKYNFKVRYFSRDRQAILEELIILKNLINPDLVLLPATTDIHQDHNVISTEGIRAFNKTSSIFGYEIFPNNTNFHSNGFVQINLEHLNKKINSLNCYKSQAFRSYSKEKIINGIAMARGLQIDVDIAEAFEIIRLKI